MLIQFDHVTRQFNGYKAVNDVSFFIDQSEIVGLLGHNGAGKTTIMKLLTGYLEPTNGQIYVDGLRMDCDLHSIQSRMGYLPENCPLWPDMSVIEFLLYQASLKGIPKAELDDQVFRIIKKTHLVEKANQPIGTLSKGYRQRVGVANAILKHPKIIILDEPTNGLDPTQTLNMRALIQELAKTSTVILSTHILQEVQAVCDRVIIVRDGKIVTDERLDELDQTKGLRVTVDQDEQTMQALCKDLISVKTIQLKSIRDNKYQYKLEVDSEMAPKISQKILEAGHQLFEISPERQDLETLFKEDYVAQENLESDTKDVF